MCGRFTVTSPAELIEEFGPLADGAVLEPRYNVAPTQPVPVVANRRERKIELFRWGLVPSWADDPAIGNRMINARSEGLTEKPAFRDAFRRRRCLVLADGFFEWRREGKARTPFYIRREPRRFIAFAGLWERWKQGEEWLLSCTIITGPPNSLVSPLHDRMPVVIEAEDYERWLCPEPLPPEALTDLLHPPSPAGWKAYEVSPLVNSPDNDEPGCIAAGPIQQSLF